MSNYSTAGTIRKKYRQRNLFRNAKRVQQDGREYLITSQRRIIGIADPVTGEFKSPSLFDGVRKNSNSLAVYLPK